MTKWSELAINLGFAEEEFTKAEAIYVAAQAALTDAKTAMARALGVNAPPAPRQTRVHKSYTAGRGETVLAAVQSLGRAVSADDIATAISCDTKVAHSALTNLVMARKLERVGKGLYALPAATNAA